MGHNLILQGLDNPLSLALHLLPGPVLIAKGNFVLLCRVLRAIWPLMKIPPVLLSMLLLVQGCDKNKNQPEDPLRTSMVRGDRRQSGSKKASDNRPMPYERLHGPLQSSRMEIDVYMARRMAAHEESHGRRSLSMQSFSHPACSGLSSQQRTSCPLSEYSWRNVREVSGGVTVESQSVGEQLRTLRWRVLCHMAHGRTLEDKESCPLHLPGLRSRVEQKMVEEKGQVVLLHLLVGDKVVLEKLRSMVRKLAH